MLRLTIWMNIPSFHQGALFRALSASEEVDLQVVFAKELPADRIENGWHSDLTGFSYRFLDERNTTIDAVRLARSYSKRIHIVNGLWAERAFAAALVTLAISGSRYAVYSEAPDPSQPRSAIKKLLQRLYGKLLAPRAIGLLAVSRMAEEFYSHLNVSDTMMYPFGYFRSAPPALSKLRDNKRIEVVYVGQLIHRKGVDLLLEAMHPLFKRYQNLFLSVIGKRELGDSLHNLAARLGVTDRVVFEGVMPSERILERLAAASLAVLPSRFDGWGMTVNEALSVGTPVIVSDRCGSADLVQNEVNGYVFRGEDVLDLRGRLTDFLSKESEWTSFRANAASTGECISADRAARYLIDCLKHMTGALQKRPIPPWVLENRPLPTQAIRT